MSPHPDPPRPQPRSPIGSSSNDSRSITGISAALTGDTGFSGDWGCCGSGSGSGSVMTSSSTGWSMRGSGSSTSTGGGRETCGGVFAGGWGVGGYAGVAG